ncbi:MAG: amidohydrolase family protein [Planctomycetota bacterium]
MNQIQVSVVFATEPESSSYSMDDFVKVQKIDIHTHVLSDNLDFMAFARRDDFRFLNMSVWSDPDASVNRRNHELLLYQYQASPIDFAPVTSFPLDNWNDPDWVAHTIDFLDRAFNQGIVGVKVWKNIGMELRDADGSLVMIDNPRFDPVLDFIEKRGKVLLGHLGEPRNCWKPLDEMTTKNDRSYFAEHPQYHMYLHPQMPSYEAQMTARDRMLDKHPNLKFLGCHLASLEWSTEAMSKFLNRYPNAVIGVAARIPHLQYLSSRSESDRQQVLAFFDKYQDRILYGTDLAIETGDNVLEEYWKIRKQWMMHWMYFNTQIEFPVQELDVSVTGLSLPKSIVDKIYCENAKRVFHDSWRTQLDSNSPVEQIEEKTATE